MVISRSSDEQCVESPAADVTGFWDTTVLWSQIPRCLGFSSKFTGDHYYINHGDKRRRRRATLQLYKLTPSCFMLKSLSATKPTTSLPFLALLVLGFLSYWGCFSLWVPSPFSSQSLAILLSFLGLIHDKGSIPPPPHNILSSFQVGFEKIPFPVALAAWAEGMSTKCVTEGSPKLSIVGRGTKEVVWREKSWTWPKTCNTPRFPYKALQLFPL